MEDPLIGLTSSYSCHDENVEIIVEKNYSTLFYMTLYAQ